MKRSIILSFFLLAFLTINSQSKKKKDIESIKKMCGCFEVTFRFAETFDYVKDSLYKPSDKKIASALEWAQLIKDEKNEISIQHILQMGDGPDKYIQKHWRQDWLYQNKNFYMFNGDNNWLFVTKPKSEVKKQWTQKVYQVDDSPRYEGTGSWVHVDGKDYWESTTDAPLPRREYTQRSDYNVTNRGNRHEIKEYGWLHDQNNLKIIREQGKKDIVIASEKGYNTYKRVPDSRCKGAIDWWKNNKNKWEIVRNKWNEVFNRNKNLSLKEKVKNKLLYKYLLSDKYSTKKDIDKVIDSFVK